MTFKKILITGASGYIGGRLLQRLKNKPLVIRVLTRDSQFLEEVETFVGDILDFSTLPSALKDVDTAFYLIHSMNTKGDFAEEEKIGAKNFAKAASEAGLKRIIYLGGLGDSTTKLSKHLQSRHDVGEILRLEAKNVQVIELRASIVIGSGSISFEMVRSLVERLPLMITPKWVWTMSQPIAIEDLLSYLIQSLDLNEKGHLIVEIGGKDQVSYGEIMQEYARERHLKRYFIYVPVLSPRLSSLWLKLITPLYAQVGMNLVQSAMCPTIVQHPENSKLYDVQPMGIKEAIHKAVLNEGTDYAATKWKESKAFADDPSLQMKAKYSRLTDVRKIEIEAQPETAFSVIQSIGGKTGWYYANSLWKIRGWLDLLFGGVGLRRGRKDPVEIEKGEFIDFWVVEEFNPPHLLKLHAEMKMPGQAWLEFKVEKTANGCQITQTALFDPSSWWGIGYWYALYPFHYFVFKGMLNAIGKATLAKKNS